MYNKPRVLIPALVFLILGSGFLGFGCSSSDPPTRIVPQPVKPDRSSPQAVLASLREAYLDREAADYESLLAADFEFYFSEEDQATLGDTLSHSEEIAVHQNMFASGDVQYISLTFQLLELSRDDAKPDPMRPGQHLWTIIMASADLEVRKLHDGMLRSYVMRDGVEQFWFRREARVEPGTGHAIWTLVEWKELIDPEPPVKVPTCRFGPPERASWGGIKGLFRSHK